MDHLYLSANTIEKIFCALNPVTQIIYFSAAQVEVALIEQINGVGGNTSPSVPVI